MSARITIAASVLVTVAACAPVGPEFARPDMPMPPAWLDAERASFDASPAELADWWRVLEDPVLDRLVDTARKQNDNLKIAGLRVLESQASLGIARGNQYPQVQVAVGDATALGASESAPNTAAGDLEFIQYNAGAAVSWEFDFWGRFRRAIEAADADLARTMADYDDVLVLLTAGVVETYAVMRATEVQLELAQRSLGIQQRSYEIVDLLYRRGDSSELDALQAHSLLLGTKATIPVLEAGVRRSKNALATLLGMLPGDVDPLLGAPGTMPSVPQQFAIGMPADLLRQRPDVRAAEMAALAQNAIVGVATAGLYPSFSLDGYLGLAAADNTNTTRTGETGIDQLFRSESLTYSAGASFIWPFLNYGRIRNNIRVQDARLQQALAAWRATVIRAAGEVEDALIGFRSARAQHRILADSVATAERSAEIAMLRYQEGFADYQRVLDSQQRLFNQQQRYASNLGDVMRSFAAIYRSLGGGWQLAAPEYVDEETRRDMQERTDWGGLLETDPAPAAVQ